MATSFWGDSFSRIFGYQSPSAILLPEYNYQTISNAIKTRYDRLNEACGLSMEIGHDDKPNPSGLYTREREDWALAEQQRYDELTKEESQLRHQLIALVLIAEEHLSEDEITQIRDKVPMDAEEWACTRYGWACGEALEGDEDE